MSRRRPSPPDIPRAAGPSPAPIDRASTAETARILVLKERLAATLQRAANVVDASRALYRVSRYRRQLRLLSRSSLRPQ
jgi:hypothetical protein